MNALGLSGDQQIALLRIALIERVRHEARRQREMVVYGLDDALLQLRQQGSFSRSSSPGAMQILDGLCDELEITGMQRTRMQSMLARP